MPESRPRRPVAVVALAAVLLLCTATVAEAQDFTYQRPHDFTLGWGRRVGLTMAAASAGLILYVLIVRRKRLLDVTSRWLLFLGVCAIPFPLSLLSTAVGLETSKSPEFCGSCHAMEPFIADMKDPDSKTLAAVHYRNRYIHSEQCYLCHTNYGVFGTLEAKKAGLGHIWMQSTGSYELPIRIAKPYDFTICLNCHGESEKFKAEKMHQRPLRQRENEEEWSCLKCHFLNAHPKPETRGG